MKEKPNGLFAFADFYGTGCAVGLPPSEVRAMSLWQFAACVHGWNMAQMSEDERNKMLDDDEADAIWDMLDIAPIWERPPGERLH